MRRVALITGGARGIGYGIARCLAAEGCDLAISGARPHSETEKSLQALRDLGSDVLYCQSDVSDAEARAHLLQEIRSHYGRLHILINNAGVAPTVRADILEATEESFQRVLRINLQGPYFLTQAVARWMVEQKRGVGACTDAACTDAPFAGCIVNVSSISATVASTSRGEYCISKAGVSMATQLWAVRLAEFGIAVYEVRPGIIKTDMTAGVTDKYDKLIGEGLLLQARWGLPEDVGRAVAMLVRGDLPYSTGQVLTVDGGLTLQRL